MSGAAASRQESLAGGLRATLADEVQRRRVPGAAAALRVAGETADAAAGITSVRAPVPVDEETLFQIGSITKVFTALALLRLVDADRVRLDDKVRTVLPALTLADEAAARRVTLRHLLTHTAGWDGDLLDDTGAGDDALAEFVSRVATLPQLTEPGTTFAYNNSGFSILGRVLEVITGAPYEAAVTELVLEPLRLERACFFADDVVTSRFVVGHDWAGDRLTVAKPWATPRAINPSGGLITTVRDLLRLADPFLTRAASLLTPSLRDEMVEPQVDAVGGPKLADWLGLAWMIGTSATPKFFSTPAG